MNLKVAERFIEIALAVTMTILGVGGLVLGAYFILVAKELRTGIFFGRIAMLGLFYLVGAFGWRYFNS